MKFIPYQLLDGRPSLVVDGSPAPGTVLNVTHWPGYPPPAGIEAGRSPLGCRLGPLVRFLAVAPGSGSAWLTRSMSMRRFRRPSNGS
jgi:hypothetical protein